MLTLLCVLGQEYLQLWLQLHATQVNAARLQELFNTYQNEVDAALEAQNYFYDRVLMLRTSIMIYMRDAVWAYKYYTLSESSIVLDPLKSTLAYQQDSQMIVQEVTTSKERYSSDVTIKSRSPTGEDFKLISCVPLAFIVTTLTTEVSEHPGMCSGNLQIDFA